jgi:hypothetical protein
VYRTSAVLGILGSLAACSADAVVPDTSNPLHCGAALAFLLAIAKTNGDLPMERELLKRMKWEAQRAGAVSDKQKTMSELQLLRKRFVADREEGKNVAFECLKREDADPLFRREVMKRKE